MEQYISLSETSYLHKQVGRLFEEVAELRKEIAKLRIESKSDDYARIIFGSPREISNNVSDKQTLLPISRGEFEQNREAYEQEEVSLLEKYNRQYVAFCHGKLVAAGPDRKQVIQEAMQTEPTARPYIRQVGVEIPSRPAGRR